jgi:ubiquinone/menaquinone biosynthesis C-methylase UbiE
MGTQSTQKHTSAEEKRVKELWSKEAGSWKIGRGLHWTEHLEVRKRVNRMVSNEESVEALEYLVKFLKKNGKNVPVGRAATLGCGAGDLERGLAKYNFAREHIGFDIAEGAVEKARAEAKKQGLSNLKYVAADVNEVSLPRASFDVILVQMSAHHFAKLEKIFSMVARALKPDGYFYINEFVGPSRFQWTDAQLAVCNLLLETLPDKYRTRIQTGKEKELILRPTIADMIIMDPSEAIRSAEIIPVLQQYFEIVERHDYGGTVLHMLLEGIAGNFRQDSPEDMRYLRRMFDMEDRFIAAGILKSDFSMLLARPRSLASQKSRVAKKALARVAKKTAARLGIKVSHV